jgi:hypothetical protein
VLLTAQRNSPRDLLGDGTTAPVVELPARKINGLDRARAADGLGSLSCVVQAACTKQLSRPKQSAQSRRPRPALRPVDL